MNEAHLEDYNLSPQGDGNFLMISSTFFASTDYNLSPQGDGNSCWLKYLMTSGRITTYPRKGTVTELDHRIILSSIDYNLSP